MAGTKNTHPHPQPTGCPRSLGTDLTIRVRALMPQNPNSVLDRPHPPAEADQMKDQRSTFH